MHRFIAGAVAALICVTAYAQEIASQLPVLAPLAVAWAQRMQAEALVRGAPLAPQLRELARSVGVSDPSRVRIVVVDRVPMPDDPMLKAAALRVGMSQESASGLTLGHAIFVRRGDEHDARLLTHELRHVAQYEAAGGVAPFLARHLADLVQHGYEDSPYEIDARAHERAALPPDAS